MRLNILIGGKAGQGINKVSGIIAETLVKNGYYIFNYRDYPSIIRGGNNFNIVSISDRPIASHESAIDVVIALDEDTIKIHKSSLKKDGLILAYKDFSGLGLNTNVALAGSLIKVLGFDNKVLASVVKAKIKNKLSVDALTEGYNKQTSKFNLKVLNNQISILSGSSAIAKGAINSKIDMYFAYPMTPATGVSEMLAKDQLKNNCLVFQPEGEISAINMALGASFSGARTMVGTSGGGYDLMSEGLSLQGMSQIPLVVYLASRPGPATGLPTYSMQGDLEIALRSGHGEFPRIVVAPGDPDEAMEKVNEAFYLSEKFGALSILLSDKHLAKSEFSIFSKNKKTLPVVVKRLIPGQGVVKVSGYESDADGLATEDPKIAIKNADNRLKKYQAIKKECQKLEMIKIYGKADSKNLVIGWGSTKGAIVDAIDGEDFKFLQVLYMMPMSNQIKSEILAAKNVILVETNLTGQLGRLIREKTGLKIEKRILKYDGRPFKSDELKQELLNKLKS